MIVMKFGGTSVADAEALRRLRGLVEARRHEKPLVVVSALAGVSDVLAATASSADWTEAARHLEERHRDLMTQVGGDPALLQPWLEALRAGPTAPADWMALGELLSSTVVASALADLGSRWFDVRSVMRTAGQDSLRDRPDRDVIGRLAARHLRHEIDSGAVVVTQGFIGCDTAGGTTLLGRGGSDYSASLLGAALQAERIEIWTDVDGIMTGPPRVVPAARRLKVLSFDEAAELAYFGAKVLHPATIRPAQEARIPVLVVNARRAPGSGDFAAGTLILTDTSAYHDERAVVRSVAVKHGVTVVTVHSTRMLMAHGFLESLFAVFSRRATPVDLVATSEVSVSLTVDDTQGLDAIVDELAGIARVEVTPGMAIVCVVGEGMRRARGIPGRVFRAVGGTEVRMISQGASEINVSLVVAQGEADDVVRRLHEEFFQGNLPRAVFGEAYTDLRTLDDAGVPAQEHRLAPVVRHLAERHGTPFYLYELDRVEAQVQRLREALGHPRIRLAYACKANFHRALFTLMRDLHVGIDAVSPMEVERALECGIPAADVLFTANNVAIDTLLQLHDRGVPVNLGSLSDVRRFASQRADTRVFLRFNPGLGVGHHSHVVTGGLDSKFGILEPDLAAAREELQRRRIDVVGLHAHIGSGSLDPAPFLEAARRMARLAAAFPALQVLNVGGGLGVPYRRDEPEFDLAAYAAGLRDVLDAAEDAAGRELQLWVEPGRFLVAQAGTLVARVTCRKETAGHVYVGLDTGMNHLVRPALYGAYHPIRNVSAPGGAIEFVDVVGNICESSDVFAMNRPLPSPQEGHLLAIEAAGAYGYAMASHYNLWPLPQEHVVRHGQIVDDA